MPDSERWDGSSTLSTEIGNRLRERRQELGKSLREIAAGASVSLGHLSEIENGRSHASIPVLLRLGRVLRYPLADLLPRIGDRRVHQSRLHSRGPAISVLSHQDLELKVLGLRLAAGESAAPPFDPGADMLVFVVSGECDIEVGAVRHTLRERDSADIEHATALGVRARSDTLMMLLQGKRR